MGSIEDLRRLLGDDVVSTGQIDLQTYGQDLWPKMQIAKLGGRPSTYRPDCVARPRSVDDIVTITKWCKDTATPLVPYGAGSCVTGGALPSRGGVVMDVRHLDRIESIDAESMTATVQAGIVGETLERELEHRGYTLGHFPSSIWCSTLGGWLAARSAGQYSSKYGKIEDMTTGLTLVDGAGRVVTTSRSMEAITGVPLTDLVIGSEGTLGTITSATVRIQPMPEARAFRGFELRTTEGGVEAMRAVMQAGLKPAVLRLYDPFDSWIAGKGGPSSTENVSGILDGLKELLESQGMTRLLSPFVSGLSKSAIGLALTRPLVLNKLVDLLPVSSLLIIGFEGTEREVRDDMALAGRILARAGGRDLGPGPGEHWHAHRYSVSFKQARIFMSDAFVDTMEVATTWRNLERLHREIRRAMSPLAFIMAHFSHAYKEGCSIYFTFAGAARTPTAMSTLYDRVWDRGMRTTIRAGGTLSHHHGVGLLKRDMMHQEHTGGRALFDALKGVFDPAGVMNPDKLWPPTSGGAQ